MSTILYSTACELHPTNGTADQIRAQFKAARDQSVSAAQARFPGDELIVAGVHQWHDEAEALFETQAARATVPSTFVWNLSGSANNAPAPSTTLNFTAHAMNHYPVDGYTAPESDEAPAA